MFLFFSERTPELLAIDEMYPKFVDEEVNITELLLTMPNYWNLDPERLCRRVWTFASTREKFTALVSFLCP